MSKMLEQIKKNRTCRSFEAVEIPEEDIKTILSAVRYTASATNGQVLRFLYTKDKKECQAIFPHTRWAGAISWNPRIEEGPSAYILVCVATEKATANQCIDMGLALQSMTLVAQDLGYSSCILGAYNKKEVETLLGLPDGYFSYLLLAIGKGKDEVSVIDAEDTTIKYERAANNQHKVYKLTLEHLLLTSTHEKN